MEPSMRTKGIRAHDSTFPSDIFLPNHPFYKTTGTLTNRYISLQLFLFHEIMQEAEPYIQLTWLLGR